MLHVRLNCIMSESPLMPFLSAKGPRNGPKRREKGRKFCVICTNTPKRSTGNILGYVAQNRVPRAPSPPATIQFLGLPSL